jgi:hypothetical protein
MKKIMPSSILVNNIPDAFSEMSLISVVIELIYLEICLAKMYKNKMQVLSTK